MKQTLLFSTICESYFKRSITGLVSVLLYFSCVAIVRAEVPVSPEHSSISIEQSHSKNSPNKTDTYYEYFVELSEHKFAPKTTELGFEFSHSIELTQLFAEHDVSIFRREFPTAKTLSLNRTYVMRTGSDKLAAILAEQYREIFLRVERMPLMVHLYTPDDYYSQVLSGNNHWHLDLINAEGAWDLNKGDIYTFVGILEIRQSHFEELHPDLKDQFAAIDYSWGIPGGGHHGTAVAHLAAGKTDNGTGLASIGFNNRLYGITFRSNDYGRVLRLSQKGLRIINMSYETLDSITMQPTRTHTVATLMKELYDNGTVLIGGAGNSIATSSYHYPASYDHVISVTAVGDNESHVKPDGSTYTHNDKVDLTAPGYAVPLAYNGGYTLGWGTSYSAPIVAGTVGLMLSANACLSPDDVEHILKTTAKPIDQIPSNQPYQGLLGAGLVQADAAVAMAQNFNSTTYTPLPIDPDFTYRTYCDAQLNKHLEVTGVDNPIYTKHRYDLIDSNSNATEETLAWWIMSPKIYSPGPFSFSTELQPNKSYYIKHGVWEQCTAWKEKRAYNINQTQCIDQQNYRLTDEHSIPGGCTTGHTLEGDNYTAIDRVKFTYTRNGSHNTTTAWDYSYPYYYPIMDIKHAAVVTAEIYFNNGQTKTVTKNKPYCDSNHPV